MVVSLAQAIQLMLWRCFLSSWNMDGKNWLWLNSNNTEQLWVLSSPPPEFTDVPFWILSWDTFLQSQLVYNIWLSWTHNSCLKKNHRWQPWPGESLQQYILYTSWAFFKNGRCYSWLHMPSHLSIGLLQPFCKWAWLRRAYCWSRMQLHRQ